MPKIAKWIFIAVGVLLLAGIAAYWVLRTMAPAASSIGIIGGADGPTAIFVAGGFSLSHLKTALWALAGLIGAVIVGVGAWRRSKRK